MDISEAPQQILTKDYEAYAWITVKNFTPEEFLGVVKAVETLKFKVEVDYEDQCFCFTFADFKPRRVQDLRICKTRNEQLRKRFLNDFYKSMPGRYYFNMNRLELKKLW